MNKFAFVFAAAVSLPSVAHAEAFNGPYFGVEAGMDNFEVKAENADFDVYTATADGLSANGAVGAINVGYDFALGSSFIGLEAFGSISSAKTELSLSDGTDSGSISAKAKESYGVAGRFGFLANDKTAVYARLGWVNTNFGVSGTVNGSSDSADDFEDGIQYGAGLETMVSDNVGIRVEYTANDYGSLGLGDGVNVSNNQIRAGMSFRF